MRRHRTHEILAPWSVGTPVLEAHRLAAVRIEPVLRQHRPALSLDLYLSDGDRHTVIPLVLVDPAVAVERDRDPLVFPFETPGDDRFALDLAELILPRLERAILAGERIVEQVWSFGPAPCFDAARAAGCFGAAPLREALARLAPYRYARRFVRGRSVRIDAPDAVGGWAMLRALSNHVAVAATRRDAAALAWYGDAPVAPERADVAIVDAGANGGESSCVLRLDAPAGDAAAHLVEVIDPLPLDVGIVFDPAEGPVRRWFAVERAPEPAIDLTPVPAIAAGGSCAGRIAVIPGRADARARPSADTDEADALMDALVAVGFDATLIEAPHDVPMRDLIHVIGTRDGRRVRSIVERARRAAIPVAIHAYDEDAADGGWWGAEVTRYCFEYGDDEADVTTYLGLLAKRAVSIGEVGADAPYAPGAVAVDDAAAALREATLVFVATAAEAESLRRRTGRRGPIEIVPPLCAPPEPAPIGHLVGSDPFALAHAPIGPVGNQLLVARCAAEAGVPLVIAGPVVDASYLERVREFGGPGLIALPGEPGAAVASALRAAAGIVVDAAWVGDGASRLGSAALAGSRLVLADRRRFDAPGITPRRVDPGDAVALTRALGEAWDEVLRGRAQPTAQTLAALAPGTAARSIIRAYAALVTAVT